MTALRLNIYRLLCVASLLGGALKTARAQEFTSQVVAWGSNYSGQMNVPANLTNAIAIAAGDSHSLVLRADGRVMAWGLNSAGQTNVPASLTNASAVAAGGTHSLALRSDGRVVAWGNNGSGQANVPASLTNASAVAAGSAHSLALRADGRVVAWGYNGNGNTDVPANLTNASAVAAGSGHSLALRADRRVVAWGYNGYGQTNVPANLTNPIAIAAGYGHSLALCADGRVVAWGWSLDGQTNVPASLTNAIAIAAGYSYSLALRADGRITAWGGSVIGTTNIPASLTNASAIAAGYSHSLALISSGPALVSLRAIPAAAMLGALPVGTPVDLVGSAYGPLPFSYQWESNGVALAAETNSTLRFPGLQLSQNGAAYRVLVSLFGVSTSAPVVLSVQGIVASVSSSPATALRGPVLAGSPVDLLGSVSGLAPFAYQWEGNGIVLPGETNSTLHFSAVALSQNGTAYRLRASNLYDATISAPAVLSVQGLIVRANGSALAASNFFYGTSGDGSAVVGLTSRFTNATIFYTLDGSPPDFTAQWYAGTFTITNSVVLRVIAYKSDWTGWDEAGPFYLYRKSTLDTTNTGGGVVSKDPPDGPYFNYTNVTVTATPNPGWTFLRWEGDASGTNPIVSVLMDTNKTVRAVFGTWLGTTVAGPGSVTLDVPDGWYTYGATARLTGVPQPGSYFGFWGNAASGNANPLRFTVANPSPVVSCIFGTLAADQVALTVLIAGSGTVARSPSSNAYSLNQSVTLTATAGSGQQFQRWSGDASGSVSPLTVVMDRSRVITATFGSTVPLQVSVQPTNLTVAAGQDVEFTAAVTGGAALSYQWLKEGVPLTGATGAVLSLPAVTFADAGRYAVVVTYTGGSVTSVPALLVVTGQSYLLLGLYPGLTLHGTVGRTYWIEYTVDVTAPTNWLPLATVTLTNSPWMWFDTTATNASQRFYRAVEN